MAAKRTMLWLLVWRALRLRFQRVSVVFAALMVGATIVTALFAVWFDINTKMSEELRTFGANFYIGPGHGSSMPQQELQSILDQAPQGLVHGASPWLYGMARTELEKVVMVGVWFESLQKLVPYWQVTGSWIGVSFDDRNAMIGVKLAERLNVQPGDSITLVDHNQRKNLQIKGIVESGDATDNMLIVSLDVAQAWLHQPGKISHGLLSVSNDVGQVENYASRLQAPYPDLEIRPVRKVSASEGQVLDKIKGLMGLVSIVILALSSLCVNTTLMAIVGERAREFALQKALGSSNGDIVRQILLETSIIALAAVARKLPDSWGWLAGIALGGVGRFVCHVLSGVVFFAEYAEGTGMSPLVYSVSYNSFVFVDLAICAVVMAFPQVRRALKKMTER